jgi:parallel beta-helix repeat protein
MKKTIIIPLFALTFLSACLNLTLAQANSNKAPNEYSKSLAASSSTIWVPDNYTTIQEAIEKAKDGDTIFVRIGTYYEHVTINKALSLIGENKSATIIDGNGVGTVVRTLAHSITFANFTIQKGNVGIFLSYSTNNTFTGNIISNNDNGIYLWSSNKNTFAGNTISNNSNGISLDASTYNSITRNTLSSNNDNGIFLYHSSSNHVSGNIILNNSYGVYVGDSDKNVLSSNKASNNQRGIYFYYSRDNILTGNTLINNSYGIDLLDSSNNNEIFHNNFINNIGSSSRSIGSVNSWDNSVEGNYWSDYGGADADKDGIGDIPYLVGENNQDNYPLMTIFLQFNILTENRVYTINTISNSTISNFQYHSNLDNRTSAVSFEVNGAGFCRVSIPHSLIDPPFAVTVDVAPPLFFKKVYTNGTHTWLYFTYDPLEHEIRIVHTSPSEQSLLFQWTVLGLTIIIVVLFSIGINYYRLFTKHKKVIEAYEREVGSFPVSHEERARIRFIRDVIEREEKIEEFKRKYGIKIQPASTLEDLMEKLGVQKES